VEEISYLAEFIDKSPRISKEYPILRDSNLFKLLFLVFDKVVNKDLLKMKKIKDLGLTPNQGELQSLLEYKKIKIIKRKEMVSLISKFKISKNPKYLIKSMLQKKRLVFFKRGHYIVIPVSSFDKTVGIDEFELNERFLESDEYYIGLYNAFNLHGFTEQIPTKLFVFNTKYSADKKILHYQYKYFKIKKDKLFGIIKDKYPYSDKERTIIDVLEYPEYLGGLSEVMDRIKQVKYDKARLIDYAIKYNSIKIIKLVGLLTNSSKLLNILKKKNALSYYTTIKKTRTKLLNRKWKIRLI
jgi:predicted transcriptional regulator of viral defense system